MKKLFATLVLLALCASVFAQNYNFSAVCESGQTLYYRIINNKNHEVTLTAPSSYWYGFDKPTGDLIIPESVEYMGITYSVVSIQDQAFRNCSELTSVEIPNSITHIYSSCFMDCSGLTGVLVLPESLNIIYPNCFKGCPGLTDVILPENINRIDCYAFMGCTGLSGDLVIPDQCTFIGGMAFYNCSSLTSLTIGAAVDTIQWGAFKNCTGLESILCKAQTPPFHQHIYDPQYEDHGLFENVPTDIPVYVSCLTINQFLSSEDWSQFTNMQGVFVGVPELTVEVNNAEYGSVEVVSIPEDCDQSTATVRAIPNEGHSFGYWKRGSAVVSFNQEYTFTLSQNCSLTACFDTYAIVESIAFPDHVVGRKINASGQVTEEHFSDFTYREDGVLTNFTFPGLVSTQYDFANFPSRPASFHSSYAGHPLVTEHFYFNYNNYDQIEQTDLYQYGMGDLEAHYYYYYDDEHRPIKTEYTNPWDGCFQQFFYAYADGNRIRTDSIIYYSGYDKITNHYNQRHQPSTVETETYNNAGELTAHTLQTYSYTLHHKTDSVITQTFDEGEWVNLSMAHYVYDDQNRVVEYQTGSWSAENSEWNITKKIVYDFDDDEQTLTVSFRKKNAGEWVWDVFSGQTLFYDSGLDEWQRAFSNYNNYSINQFTISQHYVTTEVTFPRMSEWYYEILNDNGSITYQHLEYVADTTIGSQRPKIIIRSNTQYDKELITEVTHEYIYEENGKVYWWNKDLEEFTTLYDYAAETGDEWEIKVGTESIWVHVDSVGVFEYEGETRKMLHISDAGNIFSGDIVVGFGHMTSFFPERLMNRNANFIVDGLHCYWVGNALFYHNGDEDCDAVYDELHGIDDDGPSTGSGALVVYPNPADGVLFVRLPNPPDPLKRGNCDSPATDKTEYRITNLMGQTLLQGHINAENQQINIENLPSGMYFITLGGQTVKFVVR